MTAVPANPTVLNTTAPSNLAYIDRMDVLEALPRVCTVPEVRKECRMGVDSYPHLQRTLDRFGETIPIVELDERAEAAVTELEGRLDSGEA